MARNNHHVTKRQAPGDLQNPNKNISPTTPAEPERQTTDPDPYHIASTALRIQHLLMNLAIQHTHTYNRWQTIHNFFLEKLPGRPLVDKLRVIHLYEADWNLILKYFIAYKLNITACRQGTTTPEQAKGRPGKNASDTATATIIANEIILLQKLAGVILYNDAKACFDRIIENISNLSLMSEGLHEAIALLHAQTLKIAKYFIKTKYGIGATPNGHRQPDPFLGTGQGAADSMPRWGILSDKIIKAYNKLSHTQPIHSPFDEKQLIEKIKAFVDDTNCRMIAPTNEIQQLTDLLRHNAKQWELLLFTIGGKLELSKCKFSLFHWETDKLGTTVLSTKIKINILDITDSETDLPCTITEIASTEAYKLLGVHIALDGNTVAQETAMREKCNHMSKVFSAAPLSPQDVKTGYTTVILPTLKYGLAATNIQWHLLDQLQQPLTNVLLPKMGFNRKMPRAVVHAPEALGGLGIQQLSAEQGIAHVQFIIGSIRAQTTDSKALMILIESYIITSGILGNPFRNMMAIEYIDARWMETTRIFLNAISAYIEIPGLHTIKKIREHDRGIMELACNYTPNTTTLQMINNCRLFLQVHTIAEITFRTNNQIHPAAYAGHVNDHQTPLLWNYCKSKLRWPQQARPPDKAWRQWQKFLRSLLHTDQQTWRRKLGPFLSTTTPHHQWMQRETFVPKKTKQIEATTPLSSKWTTRTFYKLSAANELDLIVTSTNLYEEQAFSWALAADHHLIMTTQAKLTTRLNAGHIRSILTGTMHAVNSIRHEYLLRNTPMNNVTLRIWLKCGKRISNLKRYKHQFHTSATAIKCEDDLMRQTIEALAELPAYTWHKINPSSPATIQQLLNDTILQPHQIPTIEATYNPPAPKISLIINDSIITSNTTNTMRVAYASQAYRKYLQDRHHWSDDTIETIDWHLLHTTLTKLKGNQNKIIRQFIHGWLPTNAHPGQNKPDTHKPCPSCSVNEETNLHFLWCPVDKDTWTQGIEDVLNTHSHPNTEHLTRLLHIGMTSLNRTVISDYADEIPLTFLPLIQEQTSIGWDQLLCGRWSKRWALAYDQATETANGVHWASTQIHKIWMKIIEKWQLRCKREHEPTALHIDRETETLHQHIQTIYDAKDQIDAIDRQAFSTPIEEIQKLNLPTKRAWLARMGPHLQASIQRAKQRIIRRTHAITEFFRPRQQDNNQLRPPHNPRAHAADFDPP